MVREALGLRNRVGNDASQLRIALRFRVRAAGKHHTRDGYRGAYALTEPCATG